MIGDSSATKLAGNPDVNGYRQPATCRDTGRAAANLYTEQLQKQIAVESIAPTPRPRTWERTRHDVKGGGHPVGLCHVR